MLEGSVPQQLEDIRDLLSFASPKPPAQQLVVMLFCSAVGLWTQRGENVQFRLMTGEPSIVAMYLQLDASPGTELWCFTRTLPSRATRLAEAPIGTGAPGSVPAEMGGAHQEARCLLQEAAATDGSFWSRGRSLQTHGGGSLRQYPRLFAQSHCPKELLAVVGAGEVGVFVLGRKKEPF